MKPVLARQMEVYAGFLEHSRPSRRAADRVARKYRHPRGYARSSRSSATTAPRPRARSRAASTRWLRSTGCPQFETPEFLTERLDEFGRREAYNHYAVGWAHAMDTPYQWTKQVASHWGGTRNGMIVHWPTESRAKGEMR